jgi:hypothetical protein
VIAFTILTIQQLRKLLINELIKLCKKVNMLMRKVSDVKHQALAERRWRGEWTAALAAPTFV